MAEAKGTCCEQLSPHGDNPNKMPGVIARSFQPALEALVGIDPFGQQFVTIRERVAGVGIQLAGQGLRYDSRNLVLSEPGYNAFPDLSISRPVVLGQHMFVERSEDYQDIVSTLVQGGQHALKGTPLKGRVKINPLEAARSLAISRPGFVPRTAWPALGVV